MRIGIVTQPLRTNYGGILQNYALQQVLKELGHSVYTINRNSLGVHAASWNTRLIYFIKQFIKKNLGRTYSASLEELCRIRGECMEFVKNNIITTEVFLNERQLLQIVNKYKFDAYIVGSDQVWRPAYSLNIYDDFLGFCQDQKNIKRVAYAASFGVCDWEFDEKQTQECSHLAKLFDGVSVREETAVELCDKYLGVNAVHVLDPTLLLEKEDYIRLVKQSEESASDGDLFCYILDNNQSIQESIRNIEEKLSLKSFYVMPKKKENALTKDENMQDFVIPSPIKWIRAFMDAKMVFTDSFHGCVFSIIFNKPFWVIGNNERGNARFDSLLKLFRLETRKIKLCDVRNTELLTPIDWKQVNDIKLIWKEKSLNFIKENL